MPNTETVRRLRTNQTDAERILWGRLRNRGLAGCKFRRQYPIGPYIVDFVCVQRKLVIELDGDHHAARTDQDAARTKFIEDCGFHVVRFWNNEVTQNLEGTLVAITTLLDPDTKGW